MSTKQVALLLLHWFEKNARDLPWRRTRDPYAIWVSEIMLQQTQVKTVIYFWERWMRKLPTLRALARANSQTIHKLWEGLGYYTRVRNMHKAAQLILDKHSGRFPTSFESILELPGIGRYTAGAICSIAFDQPRPVLDGNVIRVLTRLFGISGNPNERIIKERLWDLAERLVKEAEASSDKTNPPRLNKGLASTIVNRVSPIATPSPCSHFNQALMELGALVCTPRQPRCEVCPVTRLCLARKQGQIHELPQIPPRQSATKRRFVAFVVSRDGKFLVRQRPGGVVNAQLWEFPNIEVSNDDGDPRQACRRVLGAPVGDPMLMRTIHHTITRYRIRLDVFEISSNNLKRVETNGGQWLRPVDLRQLPFSSAHNKILTGIL